jgi:DNA ligase D
MGASEGSTGGKGDAVVLDLAGREVKVSSPDKVFFAERGETKRDLIAYYEAVAEPLLAAMGDRPVLLERYPNGAGGSSFFQKRVPKNAPRWLTTAVVSTVNGTPSDALVAADIAHVAWAVNLGCLGFHVWPSHADAVDLADELRIDLDPQPGTDFDTAREAARELRALLEEHGLRGYPKTTGKRGIHVYLRLTRDTYDSYQVRHAAVAVARELERRRPDLLTAAWWKEERGERIFVDYNQNAPHKTVFGAWCVRARPGAQVSTPFAWDELDDVHPTELTIATVPDRVAAQGDPWAPMYAEPQSIEPLLAMYQRDRDAGMLDAPWPPVYPKMPDEPPRVAPSRARQPDTGDDGAP